MLKAITSAFFMVFCFLLQCTLFRSLSFGGIIPNLMIIITASYGLMRGKKSGLLVGFFSGLLIDIFFGSLLGFYALLYMYIGYLNGIFRKLFYPEDIKLPMILIMVSDFVYSLACYILTFLLNGRFNLPYYFMHIILPEMVYTIVITCGLYPLLMIIERRLEQKEREGASKIV
ncbi:MAG: rod shape-determining protein MreD [Lachnospiraceae bacterium]|nr:rod shape-determining protein MreD [Lachnospiraceae bacterium]